jgi:predicted HicB family RNase H-like nuclease
MARPKVYNGKRVTTAVRVPEGLHGRLAEAAAEREISVNFLVVKAVEDYLDRLIPADQLKLTRD